MIEMSEGLAAALKRARGHVMTAAEAFEQRVSFIYGQLKAGDERSKDEIRRRVAELTNYPLDEMARYERLREATARLVHDDVRYDGPRIIIECDSHGDAVQRVREAREAVK